MLGGEVVVRVVVGSPLHQRLPLMLVRADAQRGWEMVPGTEHYNFGEPVRVNSLGLRGPEVPGKQPGEVRVLALGDSFVYGTGVSNGQTIPEVMEQTLDGAGAPGRIYRVVNAGHVGYCTQQELGLLRELGESIDPDVVVLFWFWNDLLGRDIPLHYEKLAAIGPTEFGARIKPHGWRRYLWYATELARRSALLSYVHGQVPQWGSPVMSREQYDAGLARLDGFIDQFVAFTDHHNWRFVVALIPDPNCIDEDHISVEIANRVSAKFQQHNVEVIDLTPTIRDLHRTTGRMPVIPFDGHYNDQASHALGEHAADYLLTAKPH